MRHRVRVGPFHGKTFLHEKWPLVLVPLPDPLRHHRIKHRGVGIGIRGTWVLLSPLDCPLIQGHNVFLPGQNQVGGGIMFIPTQPTIHPAAGLGSLGRVVVPDILVIEGVGQGVLGDDVKIPPVKIGVALVLRFFKAFRKNHVSRNKSPRIRSPEHKGVLGQIRQHVATIHPAEPMITLTTKGKILTKSKSPQHHGQGRGGSHGKPRLLSESLEGQPGPHSRQQHKEGVGIAKVGHLE